jgi:four helix bundle protein
LLKGGNAVATKGFEHLEVYRLAEDLADKVWNTVKSWDAFAKGTLGRQLVRSTDSIGANIAEGCGRGTYPDNRRFVRIARGSLNETRHWLRRAHTRRLLTAKQEASLRPLVAELGPRLNAYLRSIGKAPPSSSDK